jgi:hypothetical protein
MDSTPPKKPWIRVAPGHLRPLEDVPQGPFDPDPLRDLRPRYPRNRNERRQAERNGVTPRSQNRAATRGEVVVPEPVKLTCRSPRAAEDLARQVAAECKDPVTRQPMAARAIGEIVLLDGRAPAFLTFAVRWAADRGFCTSAAATKAIQACLEKIAAKAAEDQEPA